MFEGCVAAKGPVQIFEIDAHEICASHHRYGLFLMGRSALLRFPQHTSRSEI